MTAPLIGLTTYREEARWGVWDQRADLLPAQYAAAVVSCGGVPVLLPPDRHAGRRGRRGGPAGRAGDLRRRGRRPGPVRRGAAPAHRELAPRPGRLGARPARRRGRGRAAGARRLPGHAGDGGARRRPRSTSTRRTWSATRSTAPAGTSSARSPSPPRPAAGWPRWSGDVAHRQLPPPPVGAPSTPGSSPSAHAADGTLEAMEADRGPVLRRGPVAPGDRRRRRPAGRPGPRGRGVPLGVRRRRPRPGCWSAPTGWAPAATVAGELAGRPRGRDGARRRLRRVRRLARATTARSWSPTTPTTTSGLAYDARARPRSPAGPARTST